MLAFNSRGQTVTVTRQTNCETRSGYVWHLSCVVTCVDDCPSLEEIHERVRPTGRPKAHSSHYSQWCCRLISSSLPFPLLADGGACGFPVMGVLAPAACRHPIPDCFQAPPGGRREHGGAAPWCRWNQWHDTHTCPRLMAWCWRDGACGRCCLQPLWQPNMGEKSHI